MGLLERARELLARRIEDRGVDKTLPVTVRALSPEEAIGSIADDSFPIRRGKERVIEAEFRGFRGQAFTDRPASWQGNLKEMLALDLSKVPARAVFTAGLNAVLLSLGEATGTVHCRDEDPNRCGPELARVLEERFSLIRVGLVGLQPAILRALAARFGAGRVSCVDLNPDNIGQVRSGVTVWNGDQDLPRLVAACDLGLATGSSIVNGTLDGILETFGRRNKPLILYGNTISGVSALLCLDRLCPYGRTPQPEKE